MADSTNERKFDSLGYVISSFTLTLQENHAALQLNLADGTQNVIGTDGYQVVGDNLIQVGWDMNEHWAELTYAEDRYSGMVTVEEDFGFAVICSERL